jgi:plasmid maintenance system antidote protein VapI
VKNDNKEPGKLKKSKWLENAEYRIKNRWLNYSSEIARRILAAIDEKKGFSQARLAEILQVSPQQVSKIVKGQENLTLETIFKISQAIGVELISFPDYQYTKQIVTVGQGERDRKVVTTSSLADMQTKYFEHCDKLDSFKSSNTPEVKTQVSSNNIQSTETAAA